MSEETNTADRLERVRAIMRDWETYKTEYDPEFARTYAGQRVAMHRGRVIAHGKDAAEVALAAPAGDYPGATVFYVRTLEQREGVWILGIAGSGA
jgi:hypothetical protein